MSLGRKPDFIGIGAQKAGTSWIYACLQEHPGLFFPMKEVHFFSRQRNWVKGYAWYEKLFAPCPENSLAGEFSTSYLFDPKTPQRIAQRYPEVKLLACLRHPVDRAYSNYINDIKAGNISESLSFEQAMAEHPEYIQQGRYKEQLENYLRFFSREQILIMVYEDINRDPAGFMQRIFSFLGVDQGFQPGLLYRQVNKGLIPRFLFINRMLQSCSRLLHSCGLEGMAWGIKKTGLPALIHALNARNKGGSPSFTAAQRENLLREFDPDIRAVERLLGRKLEAWHK